MTRARCCHLYALAEEGAFAAGNYHRNTVQAVQAAKEIRAAGGSAAAIQADVANWEDVRMQVKGAEEICGAIYLASHERSFITGQSLSVNGEKFIRIYK